MGTTSNVGLDVEPLPPFARVAGCIAEALPTLAPLARVSVSEVAPRRMIEAGGHWVPWRADVAPYMTEPMDTTLSRRFDSVAFVGPARSSKSEGLVINPLVHAILAQPGVVAVFSPSKDAAQEWSIGALDPLIANSGELSERLRSGKGGDNVFGKKFKGGTRLTIDWPVKSKLAQRSIKLVIGTDYDAFDADIGGDGEAFPLMRKRTESAGSRGMTVVESSPRRPILDETWTPSTPHEAPPCEGIVGIYNSGTRGRLYWTCPHCGHQFEPRFERLACPSEGSPAERGAGAYMVCPGNGCVIEARAKAELNAGAVWLHEDTGGALVPLADLTRATPTASFWLPGPAAALAPWSRIMTRTLEAEATFARTGDEGALKAVTNTELGLPYLPRSAAMSEGMSEASLKARATDHAWQTCPALTAFLTVAVDTQGTYFTAQVEAWLPGLERVVIDRFDITEPPDGAPGGRGRHLDPARYGEDWDRLFEIAERAYSVARSDHVLTPVAVVVDMQGAPGVTPNALAFWRRSRRSHPGRFYLQRGQPGDGRKRAELKRPESAHQGKQFAARDVPIIRTGTDRLKDEVAASLTRDVGGARKLNVPRYAPGNVFAEYAAERRTPKGWRKRPGVTRNEALDLSVYALALVIVLEAEAIDWDNPPAWARIGPANAFASKVTTPAPAAEVAGAAPVGHLPAAAIHTHKDPPPAKASGWVVKRPAGRKGRR